MDRDEIFNWGINYENETYYFYVENSKKFPEFEELFISLALQEYRHKRLLEFFREGYDFEEANRKANEENVLEYAMRPGVKEDTKVYEEAGDVIKTALKIEQESFDVYSTMHREQTDGELKKLLKRLMEMEYSHVVLIKEQLGKYLSS
jgi:rubrerythrin